MIPSLVDFPMRTSFPDSARYLQALDAHFEWNRYAYAELRGMYRVTPKFDVKPEWIEQVKHVCNVSCPAQPQDEENLEVILNNLAGHATSKGMRIQRIAHGFTEGAWAIFAELAE